MTEQAKSRFLQAALGTVGTGIAVGALCGLVLNDLGLPGAFSLWGDHGPVVLGSAVCGGLLWGTRLRRVVASSALLLGALWIAVAFTPLSRSLASDLVRRDEPAPADAVFVFSGWVHPDGDLSSEAMSRLLHGLELLAEQKTPRLVLSEPSPPSRSMAEEAQALMSRFRISAELVTVGPVGTTREEAVKVASLVRERGWRRVLAVTSPTHSARASAALEALGVEVVSSPSAEPAFDLRSSHSEDRLVAFGPIVHERVGALVYRARGWIGGEGGFPAGRVETH